MKTEKKNLKQALKGIKVVDFGMVIAVPVLTRELAEHGATVIRVECHRRLEHPRTGHPYKDGKPGINRAAFSITSNTNKYGMSLDLTKSGGLEVVKRIIKWADVICEGMTPGTLDRFGLGYEDCRKINPGIIYVSSCLYGDKGPYAFQPGYGPIAAAVAGFDQVTGYADRMPTMLYGAYGDYTSPYLAVCLIMGALVRRNKTGKGMYIDQSQAESAINFLAPAILDYTVNGRIAGRMGNRDPRAVPHGCYPCKGQDRWCVLAVTTDQEWTAFCNAADHPEWTQDERFATVLARKKNEDSLDEQISAWTRNHSPEEIMSILQSRGVPAGIVMNAKDLVENPHLKERECFRPLEHKEVGPVLHQAPAYRLSKTPCDIWKAGPCLGEDNEYVYKELLGYTDEEIAQLLIDGVITTDADLPDYVC